MNDVKRQFAGRWASLILRLAIGSLFFVAAVGKLKGGATTIQGTVGSMQKAFAETWLPAAMVTAFAYVTPFAEALIAVWLIVGYRLQAAWVFTSLFMVSLAFGMVVAGKTDIASNNFMYVLMCVAGLYFSGDDRYSMDGMKSRVS